MSLPEPSLLEPSLPESSLPEHLQKPSLPKTVNSGTVYSGTVTKPNYNPITPPNPNFSGNDGSGSDGSGSDGSGSDGSGSGGPPSNLQTYYSLAYSNCTDCSSLAGLTGESLYIKCESVSDLDTILR